MPQSFEVLLHNIFETQALEFKAKNPKMEGALVTALQEILSNPLPGAMRNVTTSHLQGIIHKKHVGGRKGHRLLYLFIAGTKKIIPVYISPMPKPPFDYDQIEWEKMCEEFYQDYTNKNYAAFVNFTPRK